MPLVPRLDSLPLPSAIRYRIALVRRAAQLVDAGDCQYSTYELLKIELADAILAAVARQERLDRLPTKATPVVEVELRPKRRRPA